MTLVAAFVCDSLPVLFGDLVVSGPETEEHDAGIPTIGEASRAFPKGSGFTITGVRQKLVVFNSNLVLGWAGHSIAAQYAVKRIRRRISEGESFSAESLHEYLSQLCSEVEGMGYNLNVVGFLREGGDIALISHGGRPFASSFLGSGIAIGSGHGAVTNGECVLMPGHRVVAGKPASAEVAIAKALALTGALLQTEIATHHSLHHYFGGGYELATLFNDGFRKIDDFTLLFFHCFVSREQLQMSQPDLVLKVAYRDDLLVIRTLRWQDKILEDSLHAVSPLGHHIATLEDWPRPPMESPFLCTYVFVQSEFEAPYILTRVDRLATDAEPFRYVPSVKPEIHIHSTIFEGIGTAIYQHFSHHPLQWRIAGPL